MGEMKNGGPAFPTFNAISHCDEGGMTLRDYFAAKAFHACYAEYFAGLARNEYTCDPEWRDGVAIEAYRMADAMLAARESQP